MSLLRKRHAAMRTTPIVLAAGLIAAGLAAGGPAAATNDPAPLPLGHRELPRPKFATDKSAVTAKPRVTEASKRQAYLLKLDTSGTAKAFNRAGGKGPAAKQAAREQLTEVKSAQEQVIADLPARTPVLYTTHAVLAGVAVSARTADLDQLEAIDGVSAVYPIAPKKPSLSSSIPLQGGPQAWESKGTGKGVDIAIIDTGIDYTHADFGGAGTPAAFEAAKAITDDSWITSKVVGGYDLVGDDYNADNPASLPEPDENPLDCNGHGTHVAGISAGQGVTTGGATYSGTYDSSIDYNTLKIGPGMAPEANLYGYRVFGCDGTTNVVTEAIDMALDPDGNGDTSDHVDVINMSLGSDFGSPQDADSMAANAAVDAGVVVTVSSGNGGDLTDVGGSPGDAAKVITVANSVDSLSVLDGTNVTINSVPASFGSERSVLYDWSTKPDLSGDMVLAPDTNADACAPFTDPEKLVVAGKVPLVTWTQGALECGSITRGKNLRDAGAIGFVLANSEENFDAGINGDTAIPGVLMVKSGADAIRAALSANPVQPVTVVSTTPNSVKQELPGNVDKVSGSSSRGIHAAGNVKPDVAAVGETVFSAAVGTGTEGISETGTSMAAPTVAGLAALVIESHPTWSPEQVKAGIVNTATADLTTDGPAGGDTYAPVRVGSGRIQADLAVDNDVAAYVADDPGSVSVSFGPVEVSGTTALTKTVKVTNNGSGPVSYAVSYDAITRVAGTTFTVSPANLTVAAGATEEVTVTFRAQSRGALDNTVDPTIGRSSTVGLPRTTLAEASGHLLLTPTSGTTLRLPVYAAPRPVSSLTGGSEVALGGTGGTTGALLVTGAGLGFGANGTLDPDPDNNITSLGSGFELAAVDPAAPPCTTDGQQLCYQVPQDQAADIRQVGLSVSAEDELAYFALKSEKPWGTVVGTTELDVLIDTDNDNVADYVSYTTRLGDNDVFVAALYSYAADDVIDAELINGLPGNIDTALYDSDTLLMPVYVPALAGIDAANPRVNYGIMTWGYPGKVDVVGVDPITEHVSLTADLVNPGLTVTDLFGQTIYPETGGTPLVVTRNPAVYGANNSQGLMLVHLHNAVGAKTEVLALKVAPTATTTTLGIDPVSVEVNRPVALKVAVTGTSGIPTGAVEVVSAETGAVIASGSLDAAGKSTMQYTPGVSGTVRMLARYAGDTANQASSSAESVLTVTRRRHRRRRPRRPPRPWLSARDPWFAARRCR